MATIARPALLGLGLLLCLTPPAQAQRSPQDELQALQAPPGMEISVFASEPTITNPAAIDVDTKGRVWVAEIQWYRANAKNPPADKIKVLEDTDGDGVADKSTVFADDVLAPMSICVAGDKVFVATSPDLWMYTDKDGDLKADGPPTKLLTGFGGFNHDHGAHSLVLGPDHKWWMSHGDTGFDVTGTDGSQIQYKWGGMLRGELDGSKLETVAVNFRNPYEIAVSSFGEAFCSDNDNDGNFSVRICWIMEGGNYGWYGGPPAKVPPGTPFGEHWHFRGHVPGHVIGTLVTGFGSPCGMCFYEGDAFGAEFKNAPLHTDSGPREVRIYRHELAGAGMQATSNVFVSSAGDNYFRPDDICAAPDGSLYLSDWYDGGVGGHAYNNPDQGRIFRLTPAGKKLSRVGKPGPFDNVADAIAGLQNPNLATQYLAREKLLAEGAGGISALNGLLQAEDPNCRARALWVLDRIGGEGRKAVVKRLGSPDAAFRALAVRILRRHGDAYAANILPMAKDASAEVRREVLLALPKLEGEQAFETLVALAATYDGSDRFLLEAINIAAGDRKPELFQALQKKKLLTFERIQLFQLLDPAAASDYLVSGLASTKLDEAKRAAVLGQLGGSPSPEAGKAVLALARDVSAPAELRKLALGLLKANLGGAWQAIRQDDDFLPAVRELLNEKESQSAALEIVTVHALQPFGGDVLELAQSADLPVEVREQALAAVSALRPEGAATAMVRLVEHRTPAVRQAAIFALVDLQAWPEVKPIVKANGAAGRGAAARMMTSTGGALALSKWIDDKTVSAEVAEQAISLASNHPDANVRTLFERFLPEDQRPKRLGSAVKPAEILALQGDVERGRNIFFQSSTAQCKACHRVNGFGGQLGPDLSQIGRKYDRGALLETILDPSKAMAPEYIPHVVETESGQIQAGFVVEKGETIVLRDANGKLAHVPAAEVVAMEPQTKSLMPDLVLRDVTAQDAADMLAYMMTLDASEQAAMQFSMLGPFASGQGEGIDRDFGPEASLATPDLKAEYASEAAGKKLRWEPVKADMTLGFPAFDQVKYCQERKLPAEGVSHYYLAFAYASADQKATLLLGTDDSANVWVNGQKVHAYRGNRAVGRADDKIEVQLEQGRNVIAIKVENRQGPGGVALTVASGAGVVELRSE